MESAQANKVILNYVIIELMDNNIIRFEFTKDIVVTMPSIMEIMDICKKLCPDKPYRSLKVIKHKLKIENDAVTFFASDVRKETVIVEAVVLNNAALRIFANFYLKVKKPVIKIKLFDTEQAAVTWLMQH